jgi:preprotein translocase subunit SecF
MELFKPGKTIDFMKYRNAAVGASIAVCVASSVALYYPGLNYGIDFSGGTELQTTFRGDVSSGDLRNALVELGYESPDVIAVQGGAANAYIIRVRETTTLPAGIDTTITEHLSSALSGVEVVAVRVSPGGDKVSVRLSGDADMAAIGTALTESGVRVRGAVRRFGPADDHRFEADLVGIADHMIEQLRQNLGERGPNDPDRVEWVGPRAGEQLRYAALRALLYSIAFIMVYVAFRFDLRFAPGGVVALAHDSLFTVGVFVVSQREFNLTIVAALLTVIGYSMNDTIVVFDRIRENLGRHRDKSLHELINISITETLGRTIITSGVTMLSIAAFFIWGTQTIRDISFTLEVGFAVGTYSSIYIAAPITEWMDNYLRRNREARLEQLRAAQRRSPGGGTRPARA